MLHGDISSSRNGVSVSLEVSKNDTDRCDVLIATVTMSCIASAMYQDIDWKSNVYSTPSLTVFPS